MARIPDSELERIKRDIGLVALIQSKGIELKKHGSKDLIGLCPFHGDKETPNLIVTPSKNLFHCMGCGKGGSVIDFIMEYEGLSFRHAVEVLGNGNLSKLMGADRKMNSSRKRRLDNPLDLEADDIELLHQVINYYHERLKQTPEALDYLRKRGITAEAIEKFKIGFSDRSLSLRLPEKAWKEGKGIRERLIKLGIYRSSGHEHLNGCVVFPVIDEHGHTAEIYGRKINNNLRKGTAYHLYLPGAHKGIYNPGSLTSPEIVLCESIIDTLSFWCNGLRNVTAIYGCEGFTDELYEAFKRHKCEKVYIAYDNDNAGNRAAQRDAERLGDIGIEVYRIKFPQGIDANEYSLTVKPAQKSLEALINNAEWLTKGRRASAANDASHYNSSTSTLAANVSSSEEAAKEENKLNLQVEQKGEDYEIAIGGRIYRIRGLHKNSTFEVLKINLRIMCEGRYYIDNLDLYQAKQRNAFIHASADEVQLKPELLKRDIGKLLLKVEELQEARIKEQMQPQEKTYDMTDEEQQEALKLLKDPKLLERILEDFDKCGIVGESINKLAGYIASVSRKLDKPLAIIIQSTSAAGKSALMEAILQMMPEEETIKYSAMTGQSLYYLGETNLKNKILAIVEEEGAEKASYALKLLQSEGELTIASTGKDDQGRMKTEEYHVEGPVMIFLTTTAIDIDEELLNRCLVLTVDEGKGQTDAIHGLQRQSETRKCLESMVERERILQTHKNAQRLLKQINVVNEYAPYLTFMSDRTRSRRDHMKYLTLIKTITLLHQYQREQKEYNGIVYIEVELSDIDIANKVAHEVLGRSLDELPPQTRRLLGLLKKMTDQMKDKESFTRREVRVFTSWGDTQLKVHISRLVEMEYLSVVPGFRHNQAYEYELNYDGDGEDSSLFLPQLIDIESLKCKYDAGRSGQNGLRSALGRGPVGGSSALPLVVKPLENKALEAVAG